MNYCMQLEFMLVHGFIPNKISLQQSKRQSICMYCVACMRRCSIKHQALTLITASSFSVHIAGTVTITSHSALLQTVLNSKQVFKGQIIPLGVAFNNFSLFDACSLFSQEEREELQTFNKSWKWALFRRIAKLSLENMKPLASNMKDKSHRGAMVHKQFIK